MDISVAKEAKSLLETLAELNNIKREFNTDSYVWGLLNISTDKSLLIPYILEDKFIKAIDEIIEQIEKQIEEL